MPAHEELPSLRILIVEDSEDDALLLLRELRRGGYVPSTSRVDSATDMQTALKQQDWDLIIADHNMPSFDSQEALALAKQHDPNTPFILVSGSIGEEVAVDAMKAGAHDYLMKGSLGRLGEAVRRELTAARVRRERRQATTAASTIRHASSAAASRPARFSRATSSRSSSV